MPMVFPSSPTVGQVFTSAGRSWIWNGSTWDAPSATIAALPGLVLIANVPFTSTSSVFANNVFTSAYRNYRVDFNAKRGATGNGENVNINLRASGSSITSNYFFNQIRYNTAVGVQYIDGTNTSVFGNGNGMGTNEEMFVSMDLFNPATTDRTMVSYSGYSLAGGRFAWTGQGQIGIMFFLAMMMDSL
jgi:hypothetical protein